MPELAKGTFVEMETVSVFNAHGHGVDCPMLRILISATCTIMILPPGWSTLWYEVCLQFLQFLVPESHLVLTAL